MSKFVRTDDFDELRTYRTIVADPPWPYKDAGAQGSTLTKTIKRNGSVARGVAIEDYPVMSLADLQNLPVSEHVRDNAHCYIWTTNAFMVEAHELMRAWGFKPKTIITWAKIKADGTPSMKTGYYFRGATEHVVFGVRGSMKLTTARGVPTAFLAPRIGAHSAKPSEFYRLVEECSPERRLEMFARVKRKRWDAFGNQIDGWE